MKKKTERKIRLLLVISMSVILLTLFLSTIIGLINSPDFAIECDAKGIIYTDVSPNNCWTGSNTASEFCPLPTDLKCKLDAENLNVFSLLALANQ